MAALQNAELSRAGELVYSRYNAPWTPWFMRRNEIRLSLRREGNNNRAAIGRPTARRIAVPGMLGSDRFKYYI